MPEVTLQSYGEEMRRLVAEGLYDQAIAMGRHLLRLYPKHLQTYRILGEACLEKGNYKEAHGLFARALACDPEDLFSRVGIAVAHEKQGNLDLAIWHLERAYELSPGNAELRKELQRLQSQRGEGTRARLKLTSAAVARLYARSGLWRQAIQEFRTLLEQNPDLVDLKVALAEALWHSDQRKEAVKVCEEILAQYPHCLKANLILGEIGLRGERESEGRALLQLAQDIDPENTVAQKLFGDRSPLPARVVKIPSLEEMPAPAPESEVLITEEEIPPEALPEWLRESPLEPLREGEPPAPAEEVVAAEAAPEAPAPSPEEAETEEGIPDWLRRIRERQKEEAQAAGPVGEAQEEVPEWMAGLGQEEAVSEAPPTEELEELPLGEEEAQAAVSEEGIPDWLKQLEAEAGIAEGAPAAEAAPPEPLPEWLVGEPEAAPPEPAPEVSEPTEIDLEALLAEAGLAQTGWGGVSAEAVEALAEAAGLTEAPAAEEVAEVAPEVPAPVAEEVAEVAPEAPAPVAEETAEAAPEAPAPAAEETAEAAPEAPASVAEEVAEAAPEAPAPAAEEVAEAAPEAPAPAAEETAEAAPEAPAPAAEEVAEAAPEAPAPVAEEMPPEQVLALARERRDAGEVDAALDLYEQLIRRGALPDKVLADLESGATGPLARSRTWTLIGDLCMKQERLQKALEAYRRALELVKQQR